MAVTPNPAVVAELAPNGVLRAGINLSNFLLVTGGRRTAIRWASLPTWRVRSPRGSRCRSSSSPTSRPGSSPTRSPTGTSA